MKLSFVIPCYKSSQTLPTVIDEINDAVHKLNGYEHEIILVNDSSGDDTFSVIKQLVISNDNITGIDMSRNFGQHAALMAGMREATGDLVVCLDDDGQTPANEVSKLINKLNEGYDVVYASYESKQHSGFRNWGSRLNSAMTVWLLNKPKDLYISSYFIARRFVIDEIIKYTNPYPYVIGLVLQSTNRIASVPVNHRQRQQGASGYNIRKLLHLWLNGFTAFSVKPLRIASFMGVVLAVLGLFYAVYAFINKLFNPAAPMGWTSTIILLLIIGGAILAVLGLIGEYIGRMYISLNNSPQYVIRSKINKETPDLSGIEERSIHQR